MKQKIHYLILLQLLLFAYISLLSCKTNSNIRQWNSEKIFEKPESVAYDSIQKFLYVTNINGSTTKKDGNGFISRMKTDGTVDSLYWLRGFNAPKGIIYKDKQLYLTDINTVYIVDIDNQKVTDSIHIPESIFLNDIAIYNETVYVSDTKKNCVYQISNKDTNILDGEYKGANGLFIRDSFLYIGTSSSIYKYDIQNDTTILICKNVGNVDGLYVFSDTHFLVSNFINKLTEIKNDKKTVLDKGIPFINCRADFYYLEKTRSIFMPTLRENRIMSIELPQ